MNDIVEVQNQLLAEQFTDEVLDMYYQYEALKEQKEIFEFKLKQFCEEHGIKSVDNEYFRITYVPKHTSKRVDTEALKEDGLYEKYTMETDVKESVRVKIK